MRAGASAEIIAAETGWPLDRVTRFAEPPLAERAFIAERAQQVEMRRSGGRIRLADSVELVVGPNTARQVSWDAYRRDDGRWIVTASVPDASGRSTATWTYDPAGPNLHPVDEPARWLMGVSDEPLIEFIAEEVDSADSAAAEPARPRLIAVPALDDAPEDRASDDDVSRQASVPDDAGARTRPASRDSAHPEGAPEQGELPIETGAGAKSRKPRPKGRRASVPSWDEILFGASRGDDA